MSAPGGGGELDGEAAIDVLEGSPGPEDLAVRAERSEILGVGLAQLGESYRQIITLVYLRGMRIAQAARAMSISEDAARKKVQRAIGKLGRLIRRARQGGTSRE